MSEETKTENTQGNGYLAVVSNRVTIYIGCSRWTSANRGNARHIAGDNGEPLCGKKFENGANDRYEADISEVSCNRCKQKHGC